MSKKINLEEIIKMCADSNYKSTYNNICKDSMLEFGKQLLELSTENAKITTGYLKGFVSKEFEFNIIDKKSITDTINQVE
jgi:hypothetical protein